MKELEEISDAGEVIGWLIAETESLPEDESRVQIMLALTLARSYLVEYALLRSKGHKHADALAATASGKTNISTFIEKRRASLN